MAMSTSGLRSETTSSYSVEVVRDVRIPTADIAVTLGADLFRPIGADPVPLLITVYPYIKDGGIGTSHWPLHHWFAERGYACMIVDFRGTGPAEAVFVAGRRTHPGRVRASQPERESPVRKPPVRRA